MSRLESKVASSLNFCFLIQKSYELACHFIKAGATPDSQKDPWGATGLHLAARNGWTELVITFVHSKVNVNSKGENQWYARVCAHKIRTPLHEAVSQRHKSIAQYLVRNGALVDSVNAANETPRQLGKRVGISEEELEQYFGNRHIYNLTTSS
jgi:ankyrin repeat protein